MQFLNKIFILIMMLLMLALLLNCVTFRRVAPEEGISNIKSGKVLRLYYGNEEAYVIDVTLHADHITGQIRHQYHRYKKGGEFSKPRYVPARTKEEKLVHVYLNEPIKNFIQKEHCKIPLSAIETIELYETKAGESVVLSFGSAVGIGGVAVGVLVALVAILKSSCPFIYTYDGMQYDFTGEIFSGATFPSIERHDFLPLPGIQPDNEQYKLIVSNEVKEIQHINMLNLMAVYHRTETKAMMDKYGNVYAFNNLISPVQAHDHAGRDVGNSLMHSMDELTTLDEKSFSDTALVENIYLTFRKSVDYDTAYLVIRAKNDPWLDYSYMRFHDQLGKYYDKWFRKQQKTDAEEINDWAMDQKIPLLIYLLDHGQKTFVDFYNICGPMAFKEDVLAVDISGLAGNEFTLVLEYGYRFWDIDYVGIAYENELDVDVVSMVPSTVSNDTDSYLLRKVIYDDEEYYVQEEVGEHAFLSFQAVPDRIGYETSFFLHSKGYYDILMDPPDFRPRIRDLKKLKNPLAFTRYSRNFYLETYRPIYATQERK